LAVRPQDTPGGHAARRGGGGWRGAMDVDPVLTLLIRGLVLLVVLGLLALIVRNTRRR